MFAAFVVVPRSLAAVLRFNGGSDPFDASLQADLASFGGSALSGRVQCLDMAGGCITTLYRMQLVQSTGFLYDCYFYPARDLSTANTNERDRYRKAFEAAFLAHPPQVLVVSSDECGPPDLRYRKLGRWPWLAAYLRDHYTLVRDRAPTKLQRWGGAPVLPYGYRIYNRQPGLSLARTPVALTGQPQTQPSN